MFLAFTGQLDEDQFAERVRSQWLLAGRVTASVYSADSSDL